MKNELGGTKKWIASGVTAAAFALSLPAAASDLTVLTSGAYKQVVAAMAPQFEASSGNKIILQNDTAGGIARRIEGGAAFDVVIMTPDLIARQVTAQKVSAASVVNLARVGIGAMVLAGAPLPDISTVARFKQAVLNARSIAYIDPAAGGSSGIYMAQLFRQWGIADDIAPKTVKVQGGYVADHLLNNEATLGFQQISEILAVKGVMLIGPLPAEIQNFTTYTAAISAASKQAVAAQALLRLLASPETARVLQEKGMEAIKP
ncbi:MAG: substrate-binding domain-containing protein [Collimonas pratensis]|uniref:molybdate ABC transporter substrate-binding protein n=1 Tax=Collimonas pratensis TaxID=279113 RepID=UPI003C71A0CA